MNEYEKSQLEELKKNARKARHLESILIDLFDIADGAILILRVIIYVGSVLITLFYLGDRALAIGIVVALSVAHVLIETRYYVQKKKKEVKELEGWG